ncbi:hypothetical protein AAFF_G00249040 [Aldrovandia affinis]|uniref:Uncharacterized protein n=1 Tax=Aldrovandia affinis TaxID=143900 RepID=A0AAD7RDP0_9TELE|nr:hypothetical protein AAFF_G00249040 [Aldrovandia affinis]
MLLPASCHTDQDVAQPQDEARAGDGRRGLGASGGSQPTPRSEAPPTPAGANIHIGLPQQLRTLSHLTFELACLNDRASSERRQTGPALLGFQRPRDPAGVGCQRETGRCAGEITCQGKTRRLLRGPF